MPNSDDLIAVEIAYALPNQQQIIPIKVTVNITAEGAIKASGILSLFPEIDLTINKVGIFGKITSLDTVLRYGDRVEIYRPLIIDPKKARRERALKKIHNS